jgi:hypothetical protein
VLSDLSGSRLLQSQHERARFVVRPVAGFWLSCPRYNSLHGTGFAGTGGSGSDGRHTLRMTSMEMLDVVGSPK